MAEPIFPKSEFDGRYERARELMARPAFRQLSPTVREINFGSAAFVAALGRDESRSTRSRWSCQKSSFL